MSLILSGTDGLSDVDGTAATPAIRGTDANTGIFFPAADTIAFSEGGVEAARFDSSGNFGLGVTPSAWGSSVKAIQIGARTGVWTLSDNTYLSTNSYFDGTNSRYIGTQFATMYSQQNDGAHKFYVAPSGTAGNAITFTQAMTLDASGNLGVGTASPSDRLDVRFASGTGTVKFGVTSSNNVKIYNTAGDIRLLSSDASSDVLLDSQRNVIFNTGNSERARIDSSGNLMVGTTNSSGTVGAGFKVLGGRPVTVNADTANTTTVYELYSTGAAAYRFYVGMGGTIFATSITITAISDERLKENVRDIDTGLNSIMALKPRRFDWKEGKGQDKKNVAGFIAQEFEDVFPECVNTSKAGADGIEYKNINHETLIPTLVKAMQEQQALITQLNARITALESA